MSLETSELLDGQLGEEETCRTLGRLAADPALRDRYTVYSLVGDVLRGNSTPDDGFSVRIFQRMRKDGARMEEGYDPLSASDE